MIRLIVMVPQDDFDGDSDDTDDDALVEQAPD